MTSDVQAAFFKVHSNLPREGPGEAADVAFFLFAIFFEQAGYLLL